MGVLYGTFLKASVRIWVEMGDHFHLGRLRVPSTFGLSRTELRLPSALTSSGRCVCVCVCVCVSLVPRFTSKKGEIGLAQFERFLGCAESAVLKLGKPIRLLERRKSQNLSHVERM